MKIEEAIHQQTFRNEYQKTSINILYTANWIESVYKDILKDHDITVQQYNILRILKGQKKEVITVSDIKERLIDKSSDVSRVIERMRKKGWIERRENEQDRRATDVLLTDAGKALVTSLDKRSADLDNVLNKLSMEEAKTLGALLDKIRS